MYHLILLYYHIIIYLFVYRDDARKPRHSVAELRKRLSRCLYIHDKQKQFLFYHSNFVNRFSGTSIPEPNDVFQRKFRLSFKSGSAFTGNWNIRTIDSPKKKQLLQSWSTALHKVNTAIISTFPLYTFFTIDLSQFTTRIICYFPHALGLRGDGDC